MIARAGRWSFPLAFLLIAFAANAAYGSPCTAFQNQSVSALMYPELTPNVSPLVKDVVAACEAESTASPNRSDIRRQYMRASFASGDYAAARQQAEWLDAANDPVGTRYLGFLAETGFGSAKSDQSAAQSLYLKAIHEGDLLAITPYLSISFAVEHLQDPTSELIELLKIGSAKADPWSMTGLSDFIADGYVPGEGAEQAFRLAHGAAEQGNRLAMERLSSYYRKGYGVTANPQLADEWAEKATAGGIEPLKLWSWLD